MKKLIINRFAIGGEDETFSIQISYEEQYDQTTGNCTGVLVIVQGSQSFSGVTDNQGNDVSSEWSSDYPTGTLSKIYYENTQETLIFSSRYGETITERIDVSGIDTIIGDSISLSNNPKIQINSDIKVNNLTLNQIDTKVNNIYPINSLFRTTNSETDPNELYEGIWTLISSNVIDTGWQNFSWTNSTYIGTTQSSYTLNKWRITDNVLHVIIGVGCTSTINHGNEDEIAKVPIGNSGLDNSANRVWTGAVGGSGCVAGFILKETANGVIVGIKPHASSQFAAAPWYSTYFTYPLPSTFTFTSGSYKREYVWERVS